MEPASRKTGEASKLSKLREMVKTQDEQRAKHEEALVERSKDVCGDEVCPIPSEKPAISIIEEGDDNNEALIKHFETTALYYEILGEKDWTYRQKSYIEAIKLLKKLDHPITTAKEALTYKGIGKKISDEIEEFAKTGTTKKLEEMKKKAGKNVVKPIELFTIVYGIGPKTAYKLYQEGYRTLDDLRNANLKNKNIRTGLKYYEDILSTNRIPREEMTKYEDKIRELLDPLDCTLVIAGSYRRGLPTSGDIDLLVQGCTLKEVVDSSTPEIIIKNATLAYGKRKGEKEARKYMGITVPIRKGGYHRRIDIRVFSEDEYPTALLYNTGSMELNVYMRLRAKEDNMKLSEYGLYFDIDGTRADVKSEEDVFYALYMEYIPPEKRNADFKKHMVLLDRPFD